MVLLVEYYGMVLLVEYYRWVSIWLVEYDWWGVFIYRWEYCGGVSLNKYYNGVDFQSTPLYNIFIESLGIDPFSGNRNMSKYIHTNQKIDKAEIMEFAVESCKYINSWNTERKDELPKPNLRLQKFTRPSKNKILPSTRTASHKRLATKIKTALINDKRIKEEDKIAVSTYHAYLSDIRRYLKSEVNQVHHDLHESIMGMQKSHADYHNTLQPILDANALTVGLAKSDALKELLGIQSAEANDLYKKVYNTPVNHVLVDALVKDAVQTAKRNNDIDSNLQKRKENTRSISYKSVMNAIDKLLVSQLYSELAIGIAFATGRRAIEVLLTGTFEPTKSKNEILFSGQAKKGHGVESKPYLIPTVIDADKIIKAVESLRGNKQLNEHIKKAEKIMSVRHITLNKALNSRVAGVLNRRINSVFGVKEGMMYKDTRAIAINIAISRIFPQEKYKDMDINVFVKKYAGHDDDDEFKNYQHIKVDMKAEAVDIHLEEVKNEAVEESSLNLLVKTLRGIVWQSGRLSTYTKIIDGIEKNQEAKLFKITQSSIIKKKISSGRVGIGKFLNDSKAKKAIAAFHQANNL